MAKTATSVKKRIRRTPEQRIADLHAEIARVKSRAERQKAKRDPTLRHVNAAIRSIDKALEATGDAATKKALNEARATMSAWVAMHGGGKHVLVPAPRGKVVEPNDVLTYLRNNPESSGEQVAGAMDTDTKTLRPVMKGLIAEGEVAAQGKTRGTKYALA